MEKRYVRSLFDSIAHRYDLLNHLLSGGIDYYWRRRAIQSLASAQPHSVLDVATGTGDFALEAVRLRPERIVGIDIAEEMLKVGRAKVKSRGHGRIITLQTGEAESIQFADETFDATIVAFGARNFEDLDKGLAEMYRVTRHGGRIVVLEFSRPHAFPFRHAYFAYFRYVLPLVGRLVSKHKEAYTYLPDTVMTFPEGEDFIRILKSAGYKNTTQTRLTFGIASIYVGVKP